MNQLPDFFERQNQTRRKAGLLLFGFIPAVIFLMVAGYFITALFFTREGHRFLVTGRWHMDWILFWQVACGTLVMVATGSLYKIHQLAGGGTVLAAAFGARWVNPQTHDPDEIRWRNVVEEMAIASAVPVPEVFVLPGEQGINAFVAGHSPSDAAIGITEGAMKLLTRDELQAVAAHEFSKILNGDMRLNLWMMGWLNGLLCMVFLGKLCLRCEGITDSEDNWIFSGRRGNNAAGFAFLFLLGGLLYAFGSLGHLFGRLIASAVCQQRAYLSDAAAVQFTRNGPALENALKKVGGVVYGGRIRDVETEQASHLFFVNVRPDPWIGFLCTHPALANRVRVLDASFDGNFPHVKSWEARTREEEASAKASAAPAGATLPAVARPIIYAAALIASFTDDLRARAREPFGAAALIYAILLSGDDSERQQQLTEVASTADAAILREAQTIFPATNPLSNGQKIALANLALPALRQMSKDQFEQFSKVVQQLVESDRKISLFEYTLQRILRRNLAGHFQPVRRPVAQLYTVSALAAQCAVLLSAVARNGSDSEEEITRAFAAGNALLELPPSKAIRLLPGAECNLPQIDAALDQFNQASLPVKQRLLRACAAVVSCDNVVQEEEAELLRAIADSLECPLPPLLNPGETAGSAG